MITVNKFNILAIDDQEDDLEIINHILEQNKSYNMYCAKSAIEALDILNKAKIDIILLDKMMPVMDGFSFLRRIKSKKQTKDIPIIMQTASTDDNDLTQAIDSGVYWYLTKPFKHNLLRSIVNSAARHIECEKRSVAQINHQKSIQSRLDLGIKNFSKMNFRIRTLDECYNIVQVISACYPQPSEVLNACSELIVNAIEHGNLAIDYNEKNRLMLSDKWIDEINYRQSLEQNKHKYVDIELRKNKNKIELIITDQGEGFSPEEFLELEPSRAHMANGRGIYIANLTFDELKYNNKGNQVKCTKYI